MRKNYFLASSLSWCIANLGVVPLLRFCAFLFEPIFTFLFALLRSVTQVRETIVYLPDQFLKFNKTFLQFKALSVKIALTLSIVPFLVMATPSEIHLSIGEIKEIDVKNFNNFVVGNPEVIKIKPLKHKVLIKAISIGQSSITLLNDLGIAKTIQVWVISKKNGMNGISYIKALEQIDLNVKTTGQILTINGKINSWPKFQLWKSLSNEIKKESIINVTLDTKFRNKIFSQIYKEMFQREIYAVYCKERFSKITCFYKKPLKDINLLKKYLEKKYLIDLQEFDELNVTSDLKVKIKIMQIERFDGNEIDIGLGSLASEGLKNLFQGPTLNWETLTGWKLSKEEYNLSTLARPEIKTLYNTKTSIKVGAEIPYETSTQWGNQTKWKYAGLSINFKINQSGSTNILKYKTSFSHAAETGNISGNEQSSALSIKKGEIKKLFEITFKTIGTKEKGLPVLSSIPILGNLFKSKKEHSTYKKIIGLISLE